MFLCYTLFVKGFLNPLTVAKSGVKDVKTWPLFRHYRMSEQFWEGIFALFICYFILFKVFLLQIGNFIVKL